MDEEDDDKNEDKKSRFSGMLARLNPLSWLGKKGDDEDDFSDIANVDDIKVQVIDEDAEDDEEDDDFPDLDDIDNDDNDESDEAPEDSSDTNTDGADQVALDDLDLDLLPMPSFEDMEYDDGASEDDEEVVAAQTKKKLIIFAGGGVAAAVLVGGIAWMFMGGEEPKEQASESLIENAADGSGVQVFNLDELAPQKPKKPEPIVIAKPTTDANPEATQEALNPNQSAEGRLTDLGLNVAQEPGIGIVVPSVTRASFTNTDRAQPSKPLSVSPLAQLIQLAKVGPLPIVSEDGNSSFDAYSRPHTSDPVGKPEIAIVVSGMAMSRSATDAAMKSLPADVAFALDGYARGLDFWVKRLQKNGHEVLLELPSGSADFPFSDPGPAALRTQVSLDENIAKLEYILSRTTGYFGVLSVHGSKFLADEDQLNSVMAQLKRRGLMYVDGGAKDSLGPGIANSLKMQWAAVEVNIEQMDGKDVINRQLAEVELLAEKRMRSVVRIQISPLSLKVLTTWIKSLAEKGFLVVPVSSFSTKQLVRARKK